MANFDYTYNGWDKARPLTLKSTGLGKVLKEYETAKKALVKYSESKISADGMPTDPGDLHIVEECYLPAKKALDKVEEAREEAIKECGTKHGDAKKYLESAKPEAEKQALLKLVNSKFDQLLVKCSTAKLGMTKRLATLVKEAESDMVEYAKNAKPYNEAMDKIKAAKETIRQETSKLEKGEGSRVEAEGNIRDANEIIKKFAPAVGTIGRELFKQRKKLSEHFCALGEDSPNSANLWFQPCESEYNSVRTEMLLDKSGDLQKLAAVKGLGELKQIRDKLGELITAATRGEKSTAGRLDAAMDSTHPLPGDK